MRFFLEGVFETSQQAVSTAQRVLALFAEDRARLAPALGRRAGSALRVHECLERRPILAVSDTADELGLSRPTARACIEAMQRMGMAREITGYGTDQIPSICFTFLRPVILRDRK